MSNQSLSLLAHSSCRRHRSIIAIKDDSHLLQGVSASLRVGEEDGDPKKSKHHDEDDVVLPVNSLQSNGVYEGVDEDSDDG